MHLLSVLKMAIKLVIKMICYAQIMDKIEPQNQ